MLRLSIFCATLALMLLWSGQKVVAQEDAKPKEVLLTFNDSVSWRVYAPVDGFFQKANSDLSNNRFVMIGRKGEVMMGIGGRVALGAYCDFGGTIPDDSFTTALIPTPTIVDNQFNLFAHQSRINFKLVANVKNRPLVAFIEGGFSGPKNTFILRHAYISYYGFTVGQTWSAFMDLEAMPSTVDIEGPNNAISARQPMIRYTYRKNGWELALAAEMGAAMVGNYTETQIKVYPKAQRIPNIPFHVKYKSNFGHVQLSGVVKVMNYGDSTLSTPSNSYVVGGGVSLSGIFKVAKRTKLFYQFSAGLGIANYMQDLSAFNYDIVPSINSGQTMRPTEMAGGYLAVEHGWNKKFHSNIVFGVTSIRSPFSRDIIPSAIVNSLYKSAQYFAINTFWDFIPNGTIGIEYLHGKRYNLDSQVGEANRINLLVSYMF